MKSSKNVLKDPHLREKNLQGSKTDGQRVIYQGWNEIWSACPLFQGSCVIASGPSTSCLSSLLRAALPTSQEKLGFLAGWATCVCIVEFFVEENLCTVTRWNTVHQRISEKITLQGNRCFKHPVLRKRNDFGIGISIRVSGRVTEYLGCWEKVETIDSTKAKEHCYVES